MTTLRILLITCSVSILSVCTNVAAIKHTTPEQVTMTEQAALNQGTCSEHDASCNKQRLEAINHDFELLSGMVCLAHLETAQKNDYLWFLQRWQTRYKQLTKKTALEQEIFAAEQFIESIKKVYLKLELLTSGTKQNRYALIKTPINQRIYQQILTEMYLELGDYFLGTSWSNYDEAYPFPFLNEFLWSAIKTHSSQSLFMQIFLDLTSQNEQEQKLKYAILVDLYQNHSTLAEEYLACMALHQSYKYDYNVHKHGLLVARLQSLMTLCQDEKINESDDVHNVLNFLIAKLFSIRQEITFDQRLDGINKLYPDYITLFMKHDRIIKSTEFCQAYAALKREDQEHLDRYITLMEHFFSARTTLPLLFVYDLEMTTAALKKLKQQSKSFAAVMNDMPKKMLKCAHNFWHIKTSALDKAPKNLHPFGEIFQVLKSIRQIVTKKPDAHSSWSDILQYVRSGAWFQSSSVEKVSQDDSGNIALEFAQAALGNKKFTDMKSAALHVLAYASPFLLAKIVQHIKPRLNKELDTQLESLIDPAVAESKEQYSKIIDFAHTNPEILHKISEQHPEILDLIAMSLKELAQKA